MMDVTKYVPVIEFYKVVSVTQVTASRVPFNEDWEYGWELELQDAAGNKTHKQLVAWKKYKREDLVGRVIEVTNDMSFQLKPEEAKL